MTGRLPFDPLERVILGGCVHHAVRDCACGHQRSRPGYCMSTKEMAEVLGVAPRTVRGWREKGISVDQGYELAARLGVHPFNLWPELVEQTVEDEDEKRRRYDRDRQRRYRATPAGRATNRRARAKSREDPRQRAYDAAEARRRFADPEIKARTLRLRREKYGDDDEYRERRKAQAGAWRANRKKTT